MTTAPGHFHPAREAFTTGLNVVAVICALTAAVLAYLAAALLRHLRAGADDHTHDNVPKR